MKYIIISPYSRPLRDGNPLHPKNYPYWEDFIKLFKEVYPDIKIIQTGTPDEKKLNGIDDFANYKLTELPQFVADAICWFSVDNFLQHFGAYHKIPGIVVYTTSNPKYFGYDFNINLLKGKEYLRHDQFIIWEKAEYNKNAFIDPRKILMAFRLHLTKHRKEI